MWNSALCNSSAKLQCSNLHMQFFKKPTNNQTNHGSLGRMSSLKSWVHQEKLSQLVKRQPPPPPQKNPARPDSPPPPPHSSYLATLLAAASLIEVIQEDDLHGGKKKEVMRWMQVMRRMRWSRYGSSSMHLALAGAGQVRKTNANSIGTGRTGCSYRRFNKHGKEVQEF